MIGGNKRGIGGGGRLIKIPMNESLEIVAVQFIMIIFFFKLNINFLMIHRNRETFY